MSRDQTLYQIGMKSNKLQRFKDLKFGGRPPSGINPWAYSRTHSTPTF